MPMPMRSTFILSAVAVAVLVISSLGCVPQHEKEVVVYAALDKEFSKPILERFEAETGIHVLAKYDNEAQKTVSLASEIIQMKSRPRADLFWNNEILHSLRLEKLGLLEVYRSPLGKNYPDAFLSRNDVWHGFAARARVLIVNTELLPVESDRPNSFQDLVDPKWRGNCGMPKPLAGTTATHAAVLFDRMGREPAEEFFRSVRENAIIESGNKQVALHVAEGRYAWGITDTDDAIIEIDRGQPVCMVFPDQGEGGFGTLLIPNTLCIIKNGPNTDNARKLVDYLLSAAVEDELAVGRSAQFPLGENAAEKSRANPGDLKVMQADFESAAEGWDATSKVLKELFR